jgi:hypothetical protein
MTLNRHFREFFALLEKHGVEYLVVGGHAVGFHGFPRYTGDLDIFIAISPANAAKIVQVFQEFGFRALDVTEKDFLEEGIIIEIGREPTKIQVLTGIDGVSFEQCYGNRIVGKLDGLDVPFISFPDLITNKSATERAKDKIDVEELKRIRGDQKR